MREITQDELNERIRKHRIWLEDKTNPDAMRLVLTGYNLSHSNLSNSNLSKSDLSRSNLSNSNLRYSNLRYSNLSNTDLRHSCLRYSNLSYSNLSSSNLSYSDLRYADLSGSNLDYAAWPLWCGSVDVTIDERIAKQLLYHALSVALPHTPKRAITKTLIKWANGFHRVGEVPELKVEVK